jgi:hypothetical protein
MAPWRSVLDILVPSLGSRIDVAPAVCAGGFMPGDMKPQVSRFFPRLLFFFFSLAFS